MILLHLVLLLVLYQFYFYNYLLDKIIINKNIYDINKFNYVDVVTLVTRLHIAMKGNFLNCS